MSTNPPTTTNPQSSIPNHPPPLRLYAAVYQPPHAAASGEPAALAALASDFSPRYQIHHPDLVVIDIAGLERLLGAPRAIGDELRKAVAVRGLRAHVAIASTQTAAIVAAYTRPGVTVIPNGAEGTALAAVAVGILAKFEQTSDFILQTFGRWGIRTLGELAALPPSDLVARFGRGASAWQAIARGEDRQPLMPALDEERFESTMELEWPIEGLEPLSFVLTRLLEPLCTRLERRDRGAAVLHVMLALVDGDDSRSDGGIYTRRLELPTPMRDVRALRTLALLDLESHPPGREDGAAGSENVGIERVTIVIDPTPGRVLQHTLYTRPHPTPEQLSTLLARLGAVMGQDRVGAPMLIDTYRPGAFGTRPFATEHRREEGKFKLQTSPRSALRRCRQPIPARVAVDGEGRPVRVTTDRRGYVGGAVLQCAGPWRTSGEWWAGGVPPVLPPWDRDEWDVSLGDGGVYRVFRDRATDAWFIDAIVD